MTLSLITFVRLVASILLPVIVSVVIYVLDKKTKFGKIRYMPKQIIIGISFGLVAISATEYGVPLDGAVLNVRSASPLSAGLIFGWPAGLIAGFIGGIERYLTPTGDFTRIACTFGTIIAGFVAALVRKFMLDNKRPSWFYGLVVGLVTEVIHMLMVFLNNSGDIQRAYQIVEICALPMIISNGISVMLALFCVSYISKRNGTLIFESGKENISQTFQRWLFIFVIVAFFVTTFSASAFQKSMAKAIAIDTIKSNLEDIEKDIQDAANRKLVDYSRFLKTELSADVSKETLKEIVKENNLVEITFIDKNGLVINTSKESARVYIPLANLKNDVCFFENEMHSFAVDFSEFALIDQLFDLLVSGQCTLVEHQRLFQFRMFCSFCDHAFRFFFVNCNGFFNDEMFSVLHCHDCKIRMEIVRNCNDYNVDQSACKHFLIVVINLGNVEFSCNLFCISHKHVCDTNNCCCRNIICN